jgi:ribonuclease BN (tRNA processing enzyme)
VRLQFLGSGDAFGSGGRFNACFHVTAASTTFLIDCGASSMIAMHRFGVDPNGVETVFVSHLHGDHFGGLPFMILYGQFNRRTGPLTVVGPPGLRQRLHDAMEVLFPGSSAVERKFAVDIVELVPERKATINGVAVTPYVVNHYCGAVPFALRLEVDGKILAYSGDTEWAETLVAAGRDADLFICEAYFYDRKVKYHLDFCTLRDRLPDIRPRRLILTHMSADMLARLSEVETEYAEDGKRLIL